MSTTLTAGKLRFVRYATAYPGPMWYFALATGPAAWAATNGFPELLLEVEGKSRHSIDGEGPLF